MIRCRVHERRYPSANGVPGWIRTISVEVLMRRRNKWAILLSGFESLHDAEVWVHDRIKAKNLTISRIITTFDKGGRRVQRQEVDEAGELHEVRDS